MSFIFYYYEFKCSVELVFILNYKQRTLTQDHYYC